MNKLLLYILFEFKTPHSSSHFTGSLFVWLLFNSAYCFIIIYVICINILTTNSFIRNSLSRSNRHCIYIDITNVTTIPANFRALLSYVVPHLACLYFNIYLFYLCRIGASLLRGLQCGNRGKTEKQSRSDLFILLRNTGCWRADVSRGTVAREYLARIQLSAAAFLRSLFLAFFALKKKKKLNAHLRSHGFSFALLSINHNGKWADTRKSTMYLESTQHYFFQ